MYDYTDGTFVALFAAAAVFWFIFAIGFYILSSIFLMKIFDKAGVQGRWRAWVPVYNYMVFSKLGDLSPWLILIAIGASIVLSWIPVIGWVVALLPLVVTLLAAWRVGLKLQKEAVWLILYFFLSIVWLGILAIRQVPLEHRDPCRAVGEQRIPRRPHHLGGHSQPGAGWRLPRRLGRAGRLRVHTRRRPATSLRRRQDPSRPPPAGYTPPPGRRPAGRCSLHAGAAHDSACRAGAADGTAAGARRAQGVAPPEEPPPAVGALRVPGGASAARIALALGDDLV